MANEEHLRILRQGVRIWNQWRKDNREIVPDLRGANLSGAYLSRAYLSGANLRGADLNGANLSGADLSRADLQEAKLNGARLREANLDRANLIVAYLRAAYLSGANLSRAYLSGSYLFGANLRGADLSEAILSEANLHRADLQETKLSGVNLNGARLREAKLSGVNLSRAQLIGVDLSGAYLNGADLNGAPLVGTDLSRADLKGANLSRADLSSIVLFCTNLSDTNISGCTIYGISVWNIKGQPKNQSDLVITPRGEPAITVDNIKVAQFVYLLLRNEAVREVIDTITSKAVLILGRFTPPERKAVLDAVRDALRERGYVPIMFDFTPSASRDLTETIQLLANMAKFVVADLTDAKSIPQELSHIVPNLPSVPVQPILLAGQHEYAMFEHWRSYPWVLKEFIYQDQGDLLARLDEGVITPVEQRLQGRSAESDVVKLRAENEELQRQLVELQNALQRQGEAGVKS